MIEHDKVVTAYRLILGREPESEAILDLMSRQPSLEALSLKLFASEEFHRRVALGVMPAGSQKWVCAEIRHGLRLWIDLMDQGVGAGALRDDWEAEETRFILSHLDSGSCFVDVGANIGWFTVLAAQKVGPRGHVLSFEPRPDLFLRLRNSVAANDFLSRCSLHNFALGLDDAELPLVSVPEEYNPGHSYLSRERTDSRAVVIATVPVHRLDDYAPERKIDLLKVDVEGAEAMVIAGARELLKRDKPFIISEFAPSWLRSVSGVEPTHYLDQLRSIGYRIFELDNGRIGNEIDDLPGRFEEPGFYTNIVASVEAKQFRVLKDDEAIAPFRGNAIVDESTSGVRTDLNSLALDTRANYVHFNMKLAQAKENIEEIQSKIVDVSSRIDDFGGWHQETEDRLSQRICDVENFVREVERKLYSHEGASARLFDQLEAIQKSTLSVQDKMNRRLDDVGGFQMEMQSNYLRELESLYRRIDDVGGWLQKLERHLDVKLDSMEERQAFSEKYIRKFREIFGRMPGLSLGERGKTRETFPLRHIRNIFSKKAQAEGTISDPARTVALSVFFNRQWYLDTYRDVCVSDVDPARHYHEQGWRERRDPGPDFSTAWYLNTNPDVASAGINPLWHYESKGIAEGRTIRSVDFVKELEVVGESVIFDREWYAQTYPDVGELCADQVRHYCESGWSEGRDPGPAFSTGWYLRENADVAEEKVNPLWHYEVRGREEGRRIKPVAFFNETMAVAASPMFDGDWYRQTNPDLAASSIDPAFHYCEFGWQEGRDPSSAFSSSCYLEENPDIAGAGINPLWHYEIHGRDEGRLSRPSGFVRVPESVEEIHRFRATVPCLSGAVGPVVMIIDDRLPEADRDSGSLDAVNMIESFIEFGYHVIVGVESVRKQEPKYELQLREMGAHPMTDKDAVSIQQFIEQCGQHVDVFVLSRVNAGGQYLELIRYNCPDAKIIFNTVDLHYVREERTARLTDDVEALAHAQRTRDREEFIVGRSDLTLLVSSIEEEVLQASVPGCKTALMPLARQIVPPRTPFGKRSGIGFVGGFEHRPNIDAIRYFLAEVWPEIHRTNPEIDFQIVGSALPADTLDGVLGNVQYLGPVESLDGWLESLRMTIAPLRIGAGAKGKVASTLCAGVPCVLSSIAAEGMDLVDGVNVMLADSATGMAGKITSLYSDQELWERISNGALKFAFERLSVTNYKHVLKAAIVGIEMPAL